MMVKGCFNIMFYKTKLLSSQKAFFCLVSPTQRALVCSSQVLIQVCFIKSTESFSVYHCIQSSDVLFIQGRVIEF